jgi:hypothetical protein
MVDDVFATVFENKPPYVATCKTLWYDINILQHSMRRNLYVVKILMLLIVNDTSQTYP